MRFPDDQTVDATHIDDRRGEPPAEPEASMALMSPDRALDWWQSAFGAGAPYGELTTQDVLQNLAHRGGDFASAVYALEGTMPHPNAEVLSAAEERIGEAT